MPIRHDSAPRERSTSRFLSASITACLCASVLFFATRTMAGAPQSVTAGETLHGRFVQERSLAGFDRPLRTEGEFVLAPGTGLLWEGETPFASTTVITAAGIVQFAGDQEALRLPAKQMPGMDRLYEVLSAALSGDVTSLRRAFSVTEASQSDHWQIALVPLASGNASAASIKSLTLSGGRFVDSVEVDRGNGDADHITLHDQVLSPADLTDKEKSLFATLPK
jgi:Outer membrane lipoprotein carrier protein LolA-like